MRIVETYVFNQRRYRLVQSEGIWQLTYERAGTSPMHQTFDGFEAARRTYWHRVVRVILLGHRIHSAAIDGTVIALVPDLDGRLHLARHSPAGDIAVPYRSHRAALKAWRDTCWRTTGAAADVPPVGFRGSGRYATEEAVNCGR